VLRKQLPKYLGERVDIDDLAVADDTRGERSAGGALDAHFPGPRLDSSHVPRLDVQSNDALPGSESHARELIGWP
jgi:hypothetical protein